MALTKIKTGGIADNAITNAKMADDAIDSADFADGAIDLAHMSVNSIDSDQYVDGSIDNVHLAGSIAVSKTLLSAGAGLTLSTNSLVVDADQSGQITQVGTLTALTGGTGDLVWDSPTFVVDSSANKVGIGTTSPQQPIHIHNAGSGSTSYIQFTQDGTGATSGDGSLVGVSAAEDLIVYNAESTNTILYTAAAERLRITSAGNVGIGVTPETWTSGETALQIGGNTSIRATTAQGANGSLSFGQNVYVNSGYKYISTDQASAMIMGDGVISLNVAASGSADAAITWNQALTVNNDVTATFGGQIKASDGTAGAPSYSFSTDPDT